MSPEDENAKYGSSSSPPPLPSFDQLSLRTFAPVLQVQTSEPDYLDYDIKGRGVFERVFSNSGTAYLTGVLSGSVYGTRAGLQSVPNSLFKVKVNAVLNHASKHGSRFGNTLGTLALLYSLSEGAIEQASLDSAAPPSVRELVNPALAALVAGGIYKSTSGPRVAALAGTIGLGVVCATYVTTRVTGTAFASRNFLFF